MDGNFLEKIEKFKLPVALSLLGIVLIIGGIFSSGLNKPQVSKSKDFPKESIIDSQKPVSVDVSGAVKNPGVYQLKDGSRIEDSIKAAGGFSNNVNQEYVSKYLNLAQKLSDGSKVYIPFQGEQTTGSQAAGAAGSSSQAKVNINTATQAEIEALPGIGPGYALKIISGRPYQQAEDLKDKKIVSNAVFEKIKDLVVVY